MTNRDAIALLAKRLPDGLLHPGDDHSPPFAIPLPGLNASVIPQDMADQFSADAGIPKGNTAQLVAEAAVHTLEAEGDFEIITKAELAALRQQAADAPDGRRVVKVYCQCDSGRVDPLLTLAVGKSDEVVIPGNLLLPHLARRDPQCPGHGVR